VDAIATNRPKPIKEDTVVGYLAEAAQLRMPVAWPQLLATCNVDAPCCAQVRAYVCLCTRAETTGCLAQPNPCLCMAESE